MVIKRYAVVKMDDFNKTKSTGGTVVDIKYWPKNSSDRTGQIYNLTTIYGEGHELIACDEGVKVGWIYTDKTNIFVDSNYSTNT